MPLLAHITGHDRQGRGGNVIPHTHSLRAVAGLELNQIVKNGQKTLCIILIA